MLKKFKKLFSSEEKRQVLYICLYNPETVDIDDLKNTFKASGIPIAYIRSRNKELEFIKTEFTIDQ